MLPVAVARSSDDSAVRYVLPVLLMTSCFHIMGQLQIQGIGELFTVTRQVAPRAKSLLPYYVTAVEAYVTVTRDIHIA